MPEPSYILRKHSEDVTVVKFVDSKDKWNILASGDVIGNIKLWNLETRWPIYEFRATKKECSIPNIEYHENTNTLITSTRSPSHSWIHGWDINKLISSNNGNNQNQALFQFDTHCSSFCRFRIVNHLKHEIFECQTNDETQINKQELEEEEQESKVEEDDNDDNDDSNRNESLLSKLLTKHGKTIKQQMESKHNNQDNENVIISGNIDTSSMLIASTGFERSLLQIWDCKNSKVINEFNFDEIRNDNKNKRGMIMGIDAFSTNKRNCILVVVVSESGFVDIYDVGASKILFSKKFGNNTPLTCMTLNNKKNNGIIAGANNMLYAMNIKYNQNKIKLKKEVSLKNDGVNILKIRQSDEKIFGLGGWDHRTRIYNWKTLKPLCILKGHKGAITDIDFHPHNNLLATSSKDAQIAMYDLYWNKQYFYIEQLLTF